MDYGMVTYEHKHEIEASIRRDVPRAALVEVLHRFPVGAEQAEAAVAKSAEAVAEGISLSRRRAAKAVGLVRYQVLDEMFEQIITANGGEFVGRVELQVGPEEVKQAPVFLTTGKFGGTMVGFASHREIEDLPIKNASRAALCNCNRGLMKDLFQDQESFKQRDRFVLIMLRRDRFEIGKLASMTVCVVSPKLDHFITQTEIEEFLAGYGAAPEQEKAPVALKQVSSSFKEARNEADRSQDGAAARKGQ